jgi:hypothetical protein
MGRTLRRREEGDVYRENMWGNVGVIKSRTKKETRK